MNTVAISAAVSAIVTVLVGTLLNWGERVATYVRTRVVPDHAPLAVGSGWSTQAASATERVRVLVCCAPNRSLRSRDVDPDEAVEFVREQLPGLFLDEPVFSMPPHGVRFEASGGVENGYAWVDASGRIDLCVNVPTEPPDPGPITIALTDLVEPVLTVLHAVRSISYDRTFGRRLPGFRRRFDWAIAVSPTINVPDRGGVSWNDIRFPGRRPPRAGTKQQAYCPPAGYAATELRSWRVQRSAEVLVRLYIRDLLQQNGFHSVEDAIDDAIEALRPSLRGLEDAQVTISHAAGENGTNR